MEGGSDGERREVHEGGRVVGKQGGLTSICTTTN